VTFFHDDFSSLNTKETTKIINKLGYLTAAAFKV
jgi:hypothetical protein